MIAHLRGLAHKMQTGILTVDVQGVGYMVVVPLDVWDEATEAEEVSLHIFTYVKEDRLELYGFADLSGRMLFEEVTKISGIGPSMAMELCSVPRSFLAQAIADQDPDILTNIKGIGRKKAEKLLVDLKSVVENKPAIFASASVKGAVKAEFDRDAVDALMALGYDQSTAMAALKDVGEVETTEERVAGALRGL